MQLATVLIQEANGTTGTTTVLGPWMTRGGDNGIFAFQKIQVEGGTFTADILHKNADDPGKGGTTGAQFTEVNQQTSGGSGVFTADVSNVKEMWRFQWTISGGNWSNGPCFAIYNALETLWYDKE